MLKFLHAPPAQELFDHPVQWASSHLIAYAAVAATTAVIFIAGARVYVALVPPPEPAKIFEPVVFPPAPPPPPWVEQSKAQPEMAAVSISPFGKVRANALKGAVVRNEDNQKSVGKIQQVVKGPADTYYARVTLGADTATIPLTKFTWSKTKTGAVEAALDTEEISSIRTVGVPTGATTGSWTPN